MGIIDYIETNTNNFIHSSETDKEVYTTNNGEYIIVPLDRYYEIIDWIVDGGNGRVVVYSESAIPNRIVAELSKKSVEVVDVITLKEIEKNIGWYIGGTNVPSVGYGMFKSALISQIKDKSRQIKGCKIPTSEWLRY